MRYVIVFLALFATTVFRVSAVPSSLAAQVIYAPRPEYPTQSRMYHMGGDGLFVLRVQIHTGLVKDVQVERSTGWSVLDATARRTLMQWRFKPGAQNLPPIATVFPDSKDRFAREDSLVKVPVRFLEFGGRTASGSVARFSSPHV
jgi:TonB family protein